MRLYGATIERCRVCRVRPQYGVNKMCVQCQRMLWVHPDLKALVEYVRKWYLPDGA